MIVAELNHLAAQVPLTPAMQKAIDFLANLLASGLQPGRIEIDGANLYALIQVYDTAPAGDEVRLEAHQQYIDIQYIAAGEEAIGWAPVTVWHNPTAYNSDKDVWYGTLPAQEITSVRLTTGQAAVFYPEDAHAPKLACASLQPVTKVVVKVHISS